MALYTIRSGVENHPEKTVLQFTTDMVRQGGIVTGFDISEKSGGVGMSVDVAPGNLYAKNTAEAYPVNNDGVVNVAVGLNSSANTRIDALVCYVDLSVVPVADGAGTGIAKFGVIAGTPALSPVAPSDSDIKSSIGANTPYELLAYITVASGASAITNENIQDMRRRPFIKTMRTPGVGSASGNLTLDAAITDTFEITMTGNVTLQVPDNMRVGDWIYITFIQDATGGRTLTATGFTAMSADMSLSSAANSRSNFAVQRMISGYAIYAAGRQY